MTHDRRTLLPCSSADMLRRPTLVEYHEQVLRLYPAQSGSRERPTWELKPTAALAPAEIA